MPTKTTSKVQVVFHPALPATCCVCGKSANGKTKFLDFQKDLDFYGAVLICEDCGREMVDALDYAPVAQVKHRDEQIKNLTVMNRELVEERDRARAALDAIIAVRPDLSDHRNIAYGVDSESSESATSGAEKSE